MPIRVKVNGCPDAVEVGISLLELVLQKGLDPNAVVIEHNLSIINRESWSEIRLQEGDTLEILHFVGGG